jgi:hypothetical protein
MTRLVPLACCLALAACGGGGGVGAGGGGGQAADACAPLFDAVAAKLAECLHASTAWARAQLGTCTESAASLPSGRVRYDAARGAACAAAIRAASCDALDSVERSRDCQRALVGTVETGEACAADDECATGSCSAARPGGTCPGQCVAVAAAGAACDDDEECGQGNVCAGIPGATVCAPRSAPGAEGQPCGNDLSCQPGLFCAGAPGASTRCDRRGGAGQPCDDDLPCAVGLVCAGGRLGARTCISVAAAGAPCTPSTVSGVDSVCPLGTVCAAASSTCVVQPAMGEGCASGGPSCVEGWCDPATSRCEAWAAAGAPCTTPDQCRSGLCVPAADGASLCRGDRPVCAL